MTNLKIKEKEKQLGLLLADMYKLVMAE